MNITLNRLWIENFKGLGCRDVNFRSDLQIIRGANATGKTSLADAFMWLLFGVDYSGSSSFEIKPLGADGSPHHNLDTVVEAILTIGEQPLSLKKVFREVWKKKRGSAQAEFSGHEVNHFINNVPCREGDYKAKVAEIAKDETTFRCVANCRYFAQDLKWQDRRAVLLALSGASDGEVVAAYKDAELLSWACSGQTPDNAQKILKARRTELNRELTTLPARIDELSRVAPVEFNSKELDDAKTLRAAYIRDLRALRSGGDGDWHERLGAAVAASQKAFDEQVQAKRDRVNRLREAIDSHKDAVRAIEARIRTASARRDALREEWRTVDAKASAPETVCPTCGQAIPEDDIEKARAAFRARMKAIREEGLALSAAIVADEAELEKAQAELESLSGQEVAERARAVVADTTEVDRLRLTRQGPGEEEADLLAALDALDTQTSVLEARKAEADAYQQNADRLLELRAELAALSKEFSDTESKLDVIERFQRERIRMVEGRVAEKFRLAEFRLFKEQVNGGIAECCDVTYKGIPWGSLNNGARINVGIDICQTVGRHYGIHAPVWVDNAEAVNRLERVQGGQLIALYVTEDKDLIIEQEES